MHRRGEAGRRFGVGLGWSRALAAEEVPQRAALLRLDRGQVDPHQEQEQRYDQRGVARDTVIGFRVARDVPTSRNLLKTAVQTALFWALFLWIFPQWIVTWEIRQAFPAFRLPNQVAVASILWPHVNA